MEGLIRYSTAADVDDEPIIDFVFDDAVHPTWPRLERARMVSLRNLVYDVTAGRTPQRVLEACLERFQTNLDEAARCCWAAASSHPLQAELFVSNQVAYLDACDSVARMRLACQAGAYADGLFQGLAALEGAVVDIEALVAREAQGE